MSILLFAIFFLLLLKVMVLRVATDPAVALKKISSVTFNGAVLGIVESINGMSVTNWLKLRKQGKLGYGSTGLVGRDCEVTITWFAGGPVAVDGTTSASIVATLFEQDGATTKVATWTHMKAGDSHFDHNDDAPPSKTTQTFHVQDDFDSDNFTLA